MALVSKEEYLKRYLSGSDYEEKKKKKRKKPKSASAVQSRMKIVDDDITVRDVAPDEATAEAAAEMYDDDAPTVAGVVDERPEEVQALEAFRTGSQWKMLSDQAKNRKRKDSHEVDLDWQKSKTGSRSGQSPPRQKRHDSDSDPSPPRRQRHDSGSDQSPPRRQRHDSDSDQSPPRRHNHNSAPDQSALRRKRYNSDSDQSPPRKQRHDSDSDQSPQRRQRIDPDSDQSPPRRRRHDSDSDQSPPRRQRHDSGSDQSPPRRQRHGSDSDQSPPRRQRHDSGSDLSPPRRPKQRSYDRKRSDSDGDQSPPRRRRHHSSSDRSLSESKQSSVKSLQQKEKGRVSSPSVDSKMSKRKKPSRFDAPLGPDSDEKGRAKKTLSGLTAGLSTAKAMREENEARRKREQEMFDKADDTSLGKNAKTVFRDKETGRRRNFAKESEAEAKENAAKEELLSKYREWGKGLAQTKEQELRVAEAVHEASKPLSRDRSDQDLEDMLRQQEREGDPMLAYIQRKKAKSQPSVKAKPRYKGPQPPPNRFNIWPGYRWDGVDRSNGFEKSLFAKHAERKAVADDAYKWSVEDM